MGGLGQRLAVLVRGLRRDDERWEFPDRGINSWRLSWEVGGKKKAWSACFQGDLNRVADDGYAAKMLSSGAGVGMLSKEEFWGYIEAFLSVATNSALTV
jgi:hypothetical protein